MPRRYHILERNLCLSPFSRLAPLPFTVLVQNKYRTYDPYSLASFGRHLAANPQALTTAVPVRGWPVDASQARLPEGPLPRGEFTLWVQNVYGSWKPYFPAGSVGLGLVAGKRCVLVSGKPKWPWA